MSHTVRTKPGIWLISSFFCFRSNNCHHVIRISGCRTNLDSTGTQLLYHFQNIWLWLCKPVQNAHQLFFKQTIQFFHIFFCGSLSVLFFPEFLNSRHVQHSTDMIDFQHPHRFSYLLHRRLDSEMLKYLHKCLHRCKASIIYCCSRPVKNYCFHVSHVVSFLSRSMLVPYKTS